MSKKRACCVCDRKVGSTKDLCGEEDGIPLGPVTKCDACDRWSCPDCQHEADCCFLDIDDHADDPTWAPRGWRLLPTNGLFDGERVWESIDA